MARKEKRREAGIALLTVTIFIMLAVVILGGLSMRVINQSHQVDQFISFKECFQGVEAGLAQSQVSVESGGDGAVGLGSWTPTVPEEGEEFQFPSFDDESVSPLTIPSMPGVEYMAFAQDWAGDGIDNTGDGVVDSGTEVGFYSIYAMARKDDVVRMAEVIMQGADVNVWTNAVFAGAGHATGAVKGNVSIHGSVHILGNNVPEGGEAVVVLDMLGASLIHNNYGDGTGAGPSLPDYLRDRVPAEAQTLYNGELVNTLYAALRVKNGLVSLSGSSEIGAPDSSGNTLKETMDNVFNTDGWTGNNVTDDGDKGDPSVVFSDNGWDQDYDLGDKVPMPFLDDDWRWPRNFLEYELGYAYSPAPGAFETSPDGDNYKHSEFFSDVLSDGAAYVGDVNIDTATDYYLNLTRPADADPNNRVLPDPATGASGDDYLYYNAATGVLEINGQIEIDGNLTFSEGKKATDTIHYTGRAAILAHGNVTINTNLLTCNNGDPTNYSNSFPARNIIGIMAGQDMVMGEVSQLDLLGAFYAQGQIMSSKQTVVMGTFVANYFDMGNQVPDIYQVPELVDNLPLGMIGNWPIWAISPVSWRELGV